MCGIRFHKIQNRAFFNLMSVLYGNKTCLNGVFFYLNKPTNKLNTCILKCWKWCINKVKEPGTTECKNALTRETSSSFLIQIGYFPTFLMLPTITFGHKYFRSSQQEPSKIYKRAIFEH